MERKHAARQRHEAVVLTTLALVGGIGLFFYLLLIGGAWFIAFMLTAAALTFVGMFNYVLWGQRATRPRRPRRTANYELCPALRQRLYGDLFSDGEPSKFDPRRN